VVTLAQLGERGLIRRVAAMVRAHGGPPSPHGPGDDAAVLPDGTVVTCDVLVEGVHFRRDWSCATDIGVKAAAANLADVAAMGARPTALFLGLVAPGNVAVDWLDELTQGLVLESARAGAHLLGGDVSDGGQLVLAVTAVGSMDGRAPVTRAGASIGDRVLVTGPLGWSGAGLRLLREGRRDGPFIDAHRRPRPSYDLGPVLAELGATAMIDVSDGLASDLGQVCIASGVSIDLDLQPDAGTTLEEVMGGGEDHCLVATVPPGVQPPKGTREIGRVVAPRPGTTGAVTLRGEPVSGGWEHHR
jgi:thiamine-monophosphate kinase